MHPIYTRDGGEFPRPGKHVVIALCSHQIHLSRGVCFHFGIDPTVLRWRPVLQQRALRSSMRGRRRQRSRSRSDVKEKQPSAPTSRETPDRARSPIQHIFRGWWRSRTLLSAGLLRQMRARCWGFRVVLLFTTVPQDPTASGLRHYLLGRWGLGKMTSKDLGRSDRNRQGYTDRAHPAKAHIDDHDCSTALGLNVACAVLPQSGPPNPRAMYI